MQKQCRGQEDDGSWRKSNYKAKVPKYQMPSSSSIEPLQRCNSADATCKVGLVGVREGNEPKANVWRSCSPRNRTAPPSPSRKRRSEVGMRLEKSIQGFLVVGVDPRKVRFEQGGRMPSNPPNAGVAEQLIEGFLMGGSVLQISRPLRYGNLLRIGKHPIKRPAYPLASPKGNSIL